MAEATDVTEVATFCPLCVSRCGARATLTNGTFELRRDPSHPTGNALCVKGKAAPDITAHPDRLQYPMMRQTPSDPISGSSPLRAQVCGLSRGFRASPRKHRTGSRTSCCATSTIQN